MGNTTQGAGHEGDQGQRGRVGWGRQGRDAGGRRVPAGAPAASGGTTEGKGVGRIQKVLGTPERGLL